MHAEGSAFSQNALNPQETGQPLHQPQAHHTRASPKSQTDRQMTLSTWLTILAGVAGFAAALLLYRRSIGVPSYKQNWTGNAPHERAHQRQQKIRRTAGYSSAVVAIVAAMASAFAQ